ncbi:MAG: glycosyltransferase family 4 protein [Desulfobacteraceae bacterium]|nr:glycosyltransferase family 4 protein [Desulfobacteraceae bacterium]
MNGQYNDLTGSVFKNLLSSFSLKPYSDVLFVTEGIDWVTSQEIRGLSTVTKELGIRARYSKPIPFGLPRQSIFFPSAYFLRRPSLYILGKNRIAFPFYHGYPSSGNPLVLKCFESLKKYHHRITRIQTSHSYMRDLILETGIDPGKVFLIPIAINTDFFQAQSSESKKDARSRFGIPQEAVVVGSFQKDGQGWSEGLEPKLVKGPDIFLKTVRILKESVPELFVLLSGPARGYVKKSLEEFKVPYKHIYLEHYPEISQLYQCLDLYIVGSRQEGGPKAVLESMVCGIPLITTRVGQAMDLVINEQNGIMVEVEDFEGLAFSCRKVLSDAQLRKRIVGNGFATARENTYLAKVPLWKEFFRDFVGAA